jgi:PST family polysaccharide transporter
MRFVRQRTLEAINPVVSTAVMVPLAAGGAGYWSIVIGIVAGSFAAAAAAIATSPYPLRLRYDRGTLGEYVGFSAPLLLSGAAGIVIVQGTMLVGSKTVGLAGLGALALAASLLTFTERVDQVITRTIYPAICAVRDRGELLLETFLKSNRLALIWGIPFGFGIALFADDLVHFVLGDRWDAAVPLLQALGITSALRQVAFNWGAFFSATGQTRPLGVNAMVLLAVFAVVTVPAMIAWGLDGFIVGTAASLLAELAVRARYLRRLFGTEVVASLLARSLVAVAPAALAVLVARTLESGPREPLAVALELALYLGVTAAVTLVLERRLLAEIAGYLRGRRSAGETGSAEIGVG